MHVINNLKSLSIDMINKAQSGHPGVCLSSATILYTLYANHMHVNPRDPLWVNRDRFVLSAGHGSALLYATLYMLGFLTLKDLKQFRSFGSVTPGHPEFGVTRGVDVSTGFLGQGIANAVGMAIAGKKMQNKFKNTNLIDYYTYVLCGDGDLMEGISYEALSLAGTLGLDNLIILYDSNNFSLDGSISKTFTEDICERFDAMGFYVASVKNRENDINKAILRAKKSKLPAFIEVKTIIGEGSLFENTNLVHGKPLGFDDIRQLKEKLGVLGEFEVDNDCMQQFQNLVKERSKAKYLKWKEEYKSILFYEYNNDEEKLLDFFNRNIKIDDNLFPFDDNLMESTRDSNFKILNYLTKQTDLLFGGSADLASSCRTYISGGSDFSKNNYDGKNIFFGVREQAMGAILNGMALCGFLPFGSTFLAFADYMKGSIKMSCLMNQPVTYIFTHDGVSAAMDGPTHQSFDGLPMLRSIPNLIVYRPADFNEVLGAWKSILTLKKPSALILSRIETKRLENSDLKKVMYGGYTVYNNRDDIDAVIIATGSEVSVCVEIAREINKKIRVVSMPSIELFLKQSKEYRNSVLPIGVKVFFVEASSKFGLRSFVNNDKYLITIDSFGYSGQLDDVLEALKFSKNKIKEKIEKNL